MIEIVAYGEVDQEGNVSMYSKEIFTEQARINFRGKKIKFTLTEDNETIRDGDRKYYFGVMRGHLVKAFKKQGMYYTLNEADDKVRRMFLVKETVDTDTGEIFHEPKSLSREADEVSNEEMKEFIRRVIAFAAEHLDYGIPFPLEY